MTESTFKFDLPTHHKSIIKVIGVGGGGSNAVNHMFNLGIKDVEFIICNTDSQALNSSPVPNKLQIGIDLTEGLGAGANPEKGKNAALENREDIRNMLHEDTKMVFVTAGMGGGTGTGAAPIIAQVARELDILTVGIVTMPFKFEGKKKMRQAMEGVQALRENCDTVLVILNDKLTEAFGNLSVSQAFGQADNVLTTAAKGIAEIITVPGYVNVDFEDVKTVMKNSGAAVMGSAKTTGESRARRAAEEAINSPLLNNQNIAGAEKILLSIISGDQAELQMDELTEITDFMQEIAGEDAEVIFGHGVDPELGESIRVTIIATGFAEERSTIPLDQEQPVAEPVTENEPSKRVFDLESKMQINKYKEEIQREVEQEDLEKKQRMESKQQSLFEFDLPEKQKEISEFDFETSFGLEYEKEEIDEDAPLEELVGMAHKPSRKVTLMEQSEIRRQKLQGMKDDQSLDAASFKEKLEIPAYQRKSINFQTVPAASERLISRFNLNDDDELLGNNRFLHDNVD
ncbi:cell division protein FtsZ [Reichenbachiella sp. MALMAid0571]|uniref:cell division protein FtsZ n=1 Tax=Reichenbachiella sp. MALMAid0571 TaxID=3143939 RepID=UPI0032E01CE6